MALALNRLALLPSLMLTLGDAVPVLTAAAVTVNGAAAAILSGSVIATEKLSAALRLGYTRKLSPALALPPTTRLRPAALKGSALVPVPLSGTVLPLVSRMLQLLPS
jgi:hypothetical protein